MAHGYHWAATRGADRDGGAVRAGRRDDQAATLFGASQAARARLRSHRGAMGPMGQRHESAVRHIMGDAAFDQAYGEGAAMTLAEATTSPWRWTTRTSCTAWCASRSTPTPPPTSRCPPFRWSDASWLTGLRRVPHARATPPQGGSPRVGRDRAPAPRSIGARMAVQDRPGVAGVEQGGQLRFGVRRPWPSPRSTWLADQVVVGGPVDRAEHADRRVAQVEAGQPGQRERVRRLGDGLVVHDDLARARPTRSAGPQAEAARRVHDAHSPSLPNVIGCPCSSRISVVVAGVRLLEQRRTRRR